MKIKIPQSALEGLWCSLRLFFSSSRHVFSRFNLISLKPARVSLGLYIPSRRIDAIVRNGMCEVFIYAGALIIQKILLFTNIFVIFVM